MVNRNQALSCSATVMNVANVLDRILEQKRDDIAQAKARTPLSDLTAAIRDAPEARNFLQALRRHHPMGLIAEVKKASPSAGVIRPDFDPVEIAQTYESHGAACLSVLTDEHFFQGSLESLRAIRCEVGIPVLRKDFILDPYQLYEARAAGADAVLLIAECLNDNQLRHLHELAHSLGLETLIEVYEESNIERVLRLNPALMGVNNRDLQTFTTDIDHTVRLRQLIPQDILLVGESGIHTREHVQMLQSAGVHAILVGESLMRSADIGAAVHQLLGTAETQGDSRA